MLQLLSVDRVRQVSRASRARGMVRRLEVLSEPIEAYGSLLLCPLRVVGRWMQ